MNEKQPTDPVAKQDQADATELKNPYGGRPGGGVTLPPYHKPTPYIIGSRANYFPLSETLGPDEMRISFIGSTPWPPRREQAGTCIMVELGNGDRFFFDFGPGCLRNIIGMLVPAQLVNDIFLTHLHVDHYADIPYLYPFRAWTGGFMPLRIHGPSGRTPDLGTKAMVAGMKQMLKWHIEAFDMFPIGDGYEIQVNEFDWKDENGICYDENGVTVRHWRRSYAKDGASAYRLDWKGLSFVWTGDDRPDLLTTKYAKGADVFVTEMAGLDLANLMELKYGVPKDIVNFTIDTHHTSNYAVGKMLKEINPRIGMVTHFIWDEDLAAEMVAGVRAHWDGLFQFGTDVAVVNVTKDAVWYRKAVLPEMSGSVPPFREMIQKAVQAGIPLPAEFPFSESQAHTRGPAGAGHARQRNGSEGILSAGCLPRADAGMA
jgi:ribonuclease BN (tRNA processing enzyme)